MDVALGDDTAPSYLTPPSRPPPPPDKPTDPQVDATATRRRPRKRCHHRDDADQDLSYPRHPGQSFAIEHRVQETLEKISTPFGSLLVSTP